MHWLSRHLAFLLLANCLSLQLVTGLPFPTPPTDEHDPRPCGTSDNVADTQCRAVEKAAANGTRLQFFNNEGKSADDAVKALVSESKDPNASKNNKGDSPSCQFGKHESVSCSGWQ